MCLKKKRKMGSFYCLFFVSLLTVVAIAGQELSYRLYCCFQAVTRDLKTKWSLPLIRRASLLSYLSPPCLSSLIHLIPPYPLLHQGRQVVELVKIWNQSTLPSLFILYLLSTPHGNNTGKWQKLSTFTRNMCVNQTLFSKKVGKRKPINKHTSNMRKSMASVSNAIKTVPSTHVLHKNKFSGKVCLIENTAEKLVNFHL